MLQVKETVKERTRGGGGWGSCRERGPHLPVLPAGNGQSLEVCVANPKGHGAPREWMRVA